MRLDVHSHTRQSADNVIVIKNEYPLTAQTNSFFSVGIHPWYFSAENLDKQFSALKKMALHPNCVAIGECGLDKNISTDFSLQLSVFQQHILLSEELKKPLIIHCVKAFQEIITLKKEFKPQQTWILHGFTKNEHVAKMLLNCGIKLSFGEKLLTNRNLQEVFTKIPDESYFFETDNASIDVSQIYEKAKMLRNNIKICPIFDFLIH